MVIEWLKFRVPSQSREKFIQKDSDIWTATLAQYPGFLGKEVWINPNAAEDIILVIRWQTREQWKTVPEKVLQETEQKFSQAMGDDEYQMTETAEFQIRKFPEILH
jgi:uncharacterized protein (TIGR03792 family)